VSKVTSSIVIPVFNQAFLTRVCLASLQLAELEGAEVVVVDNGSTDDTSKLLAGWSGQAEGRRALRSDRNLGFGEGCNWGAAESKGEIIVFLNNDTFVLPGWLPALLRPFADPTVKVAGSRLLYPSGRIQHAGVAFNEIGPHHIFVGMPGDSPLVMEQRDYQVVTGAALAIRRAEFERLGGFDTSYRNSFEDVDLCLRVRAGGGRVVYAPASVAYHWESMTEGRVSPQDMRNYELFMERWGDRFEQDFDGLTQAARQAGHDLSDRVPSRRDEMDREEQARRILRFRSVRAALALRRAYRRVFPRRNPD
jgi:GT2 family glycosyltransferase